MLISGGQPLALAPQALAETTPYLSTGYWYGEDGLNLLQQHAAYSTIYRKQLWVATAVDKVSNAVARLTLRDWDVSNPKGKQIDTTSDYARLLANPCPILSPYDFWRWVESIVEIYGEAYILKVRDNDGVVRQLLPMHPTRTAVKREADGSVIYVFTVGVASAGILKVPDTEVIPFKLFNADNVMRGLSRLEALNQTLLAEDAMRRAEESWWKRGARPALALSTDKKLSDAAAIRLRNKWDGLHAGADKFGGTVVLEQGMTAMPLQLSAEEMAYIDSRKINREEVCGRYDIPPPVLQILDNATFSNITEQMRSLYRETMAPRLEFLESNLDFWLRPEFFEEPDHRATFSLDEVTRGDFEQRATSVSMLRSNGIVTGDEARNYFDLPALGGSSDKIVINGGFAPLDDIPLTKPTDPGQATTNPAQSMANPVQATNPAPQNSNQQPMSTPKPVTQLSLRSLMGRYGSDMKAGNSPALRDKVEADHKAAISEHFQSMKSAALGGKAAKAAAVGAPETAGVVTNPDTQPAPTGPPPVQQNPADWNDAFASALVTLGTAAAVSAGTQVATKLAGTVSKYDALALLPWVQKNAELSANRINAYVVESVQGRVDALGNDAPVQAVRQAVSDGYDWASESYADQVAKSRTTSVMGLAGMDAAKKSGATHKQWVTGDDPRASHAAVDAESVPIDEDFSNGMNGPGDPKGGPAETSNCNCSLNFVKGDTSL